MSTRTREWNSGLAGAVVLLVVVPAAAVLAVIMACLYVVGLLGGVVLAGVGGFVRGVANVAKEPEREPSEPPAIITGPGASYRREWPPQKRTHAGPKP
jgi:hypothetical protein